MCNPNPNHGRPPGQKQSHFLWGSKPNVSGGPFEKENQGPHVSLNISLRSWKQVVNPEPRHSICLCEANKWVYFKRTKQKLRGEKSQDFWALEKLSNFMENLSFHWDWLFTPKEQHDSSATGLENPWACPWNILLCIEQCLLLLIVSKITWLSQLSCSLANACDGADMWIAV